ncbi:hypothetical protein GJ496_003468, partial [Pomphorhynchus laevis]
MEELADDIVKGLRLTRCCEDDKTQSLLMEQVIAAENNDQCIFAFSKLVHDIVQCLRTFKHTGERVQPINDLQEVKVFCCELRELLSELGYPKSHDINELGELIRSPNERLFIL